ncbi:MAG: lipopolysaccharide transport periplasmic protein LptA [Deinococcus-Thermus bacterium]|nr:lipopolysaccharide transport periplasmic protein LptA [Deinococcota bacterium]
MRRIGAALLAAALLLAATVAQPVRAQGASVAFGDDTDTTGQPVEITADRVELDQDAGSARFDGNVTIVQGSLRLNGDRVDVAYGEDETGETRVDRVEATGNVVLVDGEDAAEAERAVYTLDDGMMVMTGDVLLTRPDTAIRGDTLRLDIDAGTGVMEGRVSVVFTPEEGGEGQ